ncbi:MAG: hypothetical protein ABII12_02170 [Planctomycetota bacterium]
MPLSRAADGERRKLSPHALLAAQRATYLLRGRRALLRRLLVVGTATADDVRDVVELPDGINPVMLGAVPAPLARAGIVESVGFVESRRPDAHARPLTLWRLANPVAALDWLDANPDRPAPSLPEDTKPRSFDLAANATSGAATPEGHDS